VKLNNRKISWIIAQKENVEQPSNKADFSRSLRNIAMLIRNFLLARILVWQKKVL
jgi:hypothetical protein